MKRELLLIILVAGLAVVGMQIRDAVAQQPLVQAVPAGPLKLGIINIQRAIQDSEKGKQVIGKLKAEVEQAKAKLDVQKKEIDRLQADYKAKKDTWDQATRQAKAEELESKVKQLNRQAEDYDSYYQRRQGEQVKPIVEGLNQTIMEIGKKEGYSIIFEIGGGILYVNPGLEVTDKIISNYNLKK